MTIEEAKKILQAASSSKTTDELSQIKKAILLLASSFARPPKG